MAKSLGLRTLGLLSVAFATVAGSAVQAADEQWPPPGVSFYGDSKSPDISGLWLGTAMAVPGHGPANNSGTTADGRSPLYLTPWPLPYTPAYQKIFDERAEALKKGKALGDTGSRCLPFGLPVMLLNKNYPDEIIQTPGAVALLVFGTFPIIVWTDGRGHPKDLKPSYNGHSIGYWVGDTLYVDTTGIIAGTPIDGLRDPHSGKLDIKWTVQRVAKDKLHVHITLYDDEAFTEPVTTTNIFDRKMDRKWEMLDDQSCFENASGISEKPVEPGYVRFY